MDKSIPYHSIIEISPISKWDPGQKCCFRIATLECHYLFQTNNAYIRDQWIHSILCDLLLKIYELIIIIIN